MLPNTQVKSNRLLSLRLLFIFAFFVASFPVTASADDLAMEATISNTSGIVQFIDGTNNTIIAGGAKTTNFYMYREQYKGTYPDTSNLISTAYSTTSISVTTWSGEGVGAGDHWFRITNMSNSYSGITCTSSFNGDDNWQFEDCGDASFNNNTRIIDFDPQEGFVSTSTLINFSLEAYINADDLSSIKGVRITLHNIDQNVLLLGLFSPSDIWLVEEEIETAGFFNFSTSTTLGEGNYRLEACLERSYFGLLLNPFANIIDDETDCQSHQFIVVEGTFIGEISQSSFEQLNAIYGSSTATSTAQLAKSCNPFSGEFGTINCITFLLIPDSYYLSNTLNEFKTKVATHFPLGYITDFVGIMSTSTVGSLTVINATLPNALPGGGSSINLNLTGVLNPILNATTSIFTNSSASSTDTLFTITNRYWKIILYILAGLYIFRRILGSHIIPHGHKPNVIQ